MPKMYSADYEQYVFWGVFISVKILDGECLIF